MDKLITEEIKRIKEIMLISEATPGRGLVGMIADTFGFFDNLAAKADNVYKALKTTDVIKANDFRYGLADIATRKVPSITDPANLSPKYLITTMARVGDDATKLELLQLLNRTSDEIAEETTKLIKNNEKLLSSISEIDKTVLKTELQTLGLPLNKIDDITGSLYVKSDELATMFKDWDVKWGELDGLRTEFVNAINDLDVNQAFKTKYSTLLKDKEWITNTIKKMPFEVTSKTAAEANTYLNSEMSKYLTELTKLAQEGKLPTDKAKKLVNYYNWLIARKKWADTNTPKWKAVLSTLLHTWVGLLLPLSALWEGGERVLTSEDDLIKQWEESEEGKSATKDMESGTLTSDKYWDEFSNWKLKTLAYDIGGTSMVIPKIVSSFAAGIVGIEGTEMTYEEKLKKGKDLFNKTKNKVTPTTTIKTIDELKPLLLKYLQTTYPQDNYGDADLPYMTSGGENIVSFENTSGIKIKYLYDPTNNTFKEL
jgi:hypothetical protein